MNIIAFDFSLNKPAMTAYVNGKISFYVFPLCIDLKTTTISESAGVNAINRNLTHIKDRTLDESELIIEHVTRASDLARLIVNTIKSLIPSNEIPETIIANEGFSFGSKGDAVLDLSGYKYILMKELIDNGFQNFKTYSPITIKATAGCAKRGMKKEDMIEAFRGQPRTIHKLIDILYECPEKMKKRTSYVQCLDDIVDSYWCYKTTINNIEHNII